MTTPEPNAKAPTPETDALFTGCFGCEVNDYTPNQKKALEHARRLERERDELRVLLQEQSNSPGIPESGLPDIATLTRERDEARAQRDKLRKYLLDGEKRQSTVSLLLEEVGTLLARVDALTASRDKLREALKGQSEFLKLLNMKLRVCYDAASRFESGTHCLISDVREVIDEKIELTAALTHEG